MEFRILGSLEADIDGCPLPLGGPRERTVLGVLLLEAGRTVPVTRLVDAIWDDNPPDTAAKQVRNAVSRLRGLLGGPSPALVADGCGYRLEVPAETLDAARFEARTRAARAHAEAGRTAQAAETLRSALALWRGPLLTGLGGPLIEASATAWEERRRAAQDSYYEHMLVLGRHAEIIAELSAVTGEDQLREKTAAQLMLALYRGGRQGDALTIYRDISAALADQLGLDPGPDLLRLHQQILTHDPGIGLEQAGLAAAPGPGRPAGRDGAPGADRSRRPAVVPRQLPAAIRHFAGRAGELKRLDELLGQQTSPAPDRADGAVLGQDLPTAVGVIAISGSAGIGKTTLAVHWAHRAAHRFPDGQLYVNLRGFDPAAAPAEPAEAIRGFLEALAVPAERIPASLDARAALYRSLLADQRMLVLLDNARDPAQVRPLLPGSADCLVIVTSRRQLTSLVAAEGAQPVTLGLLSQADARELLRRQLGPDRIERDAAAADELSQRCVRLPLALSITAARAASEPSRPLAAFTAELRDARSRLDALSTGDPCSDIRAVFSWSYDHLSPAGARMFRLLGLHPGPDAALAAAASLAGVPGEQARTALTELTRAHLLSEHVPGRYTWHDLLRAYAAEQTHHTDSEADRRDATGRLLDHYLHACASASSHVKNNGELITLEPASPGTVITEFTGPSQADAWFSAEMRVLSGVVSLAAADGFDVHAWQLPWAMSPFLKRLGRWSEWKADQLIALAAAERLGDLRGQAIASRELGRAMAELGNFPEALECHGRALDLFGRLGDTASLAKAHGSLGYVYQAQGRTREALANARRSLLLFREAGHRFGEANTLGNIAWCLMQAGHFQQARECYRQALALYRELGHPIGEAHTWDSLGYLQHQLGDHRQAISCGQQALSLFGEIPNRLEQASTLDHLGDAHHGLAEEQAALSYWQQALALFEELQHHAAADVRAKLARLSSGPDGHHAGPASVRPRPGAARSGPRMTPPQVRQAARA